MVNGTWEDTLSNMQEVAAKTNLDGIIHLGDITDGMVSKEVNLDYIKRVINGMKTLEIPIYVILGNHDSNYFYNNADKFSEKEQYEYYLKDSNKLNKCLYYYKDIEEIKVRFVFLHSFDYQEHIRYGFSDEEVIWFEKILNETNNEYRILIFSHVPPLPEIHFWSDKIRNSKKMMEIAEKYIIQGGRF